MSFYWTPWLWKHGYRHQNCVVRSFTLPSYDDFMWFLTVILTFCGILNLGSSLFKYQVLMILCDFWRPFWFWADILEIKILCCSYWCCSIPWPWKFGYVHQNCTARSFTYQVMMILYWFWRPFKKKTTPSPANPPLTNLQAPWFQNLSG